MLISAETRENTGQKEGELVQLVETQVSTSQACPEQHERLDHLLKEREEADERSVSLIDSEITTLLAKGDFYLNKFYEELVESYLPLPGILAVMKSTKSAKSLGEKWKRKGRILTRTDSPEKIYNVHDTHRARVLTADEQTAYEVFERIFDRYRLIPGTFDDYIVNKKPNGYQALQGTFLVPRKGLERAAVELQIRTLKAHLRAENDSYHVKKSKDYQYPSSN